LNQKDYYETLGVDAGSPPQKIKEAYRKLAFQYHPDRNRDNPAAAEKMKEINEAYAVLSDARKRREYDALKQQYGPSGYERFRQTYSEHDIFRGSDINQVFEEMARAFGFRSFDEVFKESYGHGHQTFEFRRPGVFGRVIFYGPGGRRGVRSGDQAAPPSQPALSTGLLGKLLKYTLKRMWGIEAPERGQDWQETILLNPLQAMQGGKFKYLHRKKSRELAVTVPPGIRDGQKLRLKGMGGEGKGGGEPGDLYLKVQIKRSLFQRIKDALRKGGLMKS